MFARKKELKNVVSTIYKSMGFNKKEFQNYIRENEQENLLPVFKKLENLESRIKLLEEKK